MNYIIINTLSELNTVINAPIYISGDPLLVKEELYCNMWAITFNDDLVQKIRLKDLNHFLSELLKRRYFQLSQVAPGLQATFYLWFDTQAMQLRFNLLSGRGITLPFGCELDVLNSPYSILENFISVAIQVATEQDEVEFLDSDEKDDEEKYVLPVYVTTIS